MTHIEVGDAPLSPADTYRLLIGSILDYAIYMLDPNGVVTSWNPGAQRFTGYDAAEIVGEHFSRFFTETDRQLGLPDHCLAIAAKDGRFEREGWRIRRDGTGFWARVIMDAIRTPAGVLLGFANVTHDLTERRLAEAREAQLAKLKEREKLLQSQKMAAIGTLSAGVAHDFNNILQSIVGALELACDDIADDSPARDFVDIALNAAVRGSSLTHHLLSYARKQMLQPQLIELGPFLNDMQKLLTRTLGPHIAMEVRVDGIPCVMADPGQLQTALLNLAINAAHAMPKGGSLIIRAFEEDDEECDWVTIWVTDTGQGMDEATLIQAVEPFFTTKGLNGTGLGLSMVQGFIEQSGGAFNITSLPGRGTTIALRLPSSAPLRLSLQSTRTGRPALARLLLVEDSPDVLLTTGAFLGRAGFAVTRVESGDKALLLIADGERYDALVTDCATRGLNGAALIAQARILQSDLAALLITGVTEGGLGERLPDAVRILNKPYQRTDLVEALQQLVGLRSGGRRDRACGPLRRMSRPGQDRPQVTPGEIDDGRVVGDH